MKKLVVVTMLCVAINSLWAGGSRDGDGTTRLTVMVVDSADVPDGEGSVTDNRWTRYIQDQMLQLGIDVEFKSRGGGVVSHTIMMATGSAPDVAFTHNRLLFSKFASDGGLTDLGPYIDQYGPNIKEVLDPDFLALGLIDGVQYAVPARPDPVERQYISLIRKDWLDALGMDLPTNRRELEAALRAFKEQDPGNIGSENVIPWGYVPPDPGTVFEPDFKLFDAMYSFMEHDLEKNAALSWPHREGLRDFLEWMHVLYQDGLLDREFATISYAEKVRKIVNGQVGFFHIEYDSLYQNNGVMSKVELANSGIDFMPVEVFQNDEGDYRKIRPRPVGYYIFVPRSSRKPEMAVAYLNWLLEDEIRRWMNYGFEGEHYELVDGRPTVMNLEYNVDSFLYFRRYMRIIGPFPEDRDAYDEYSDASILVDFRGMDELADEIASRDHFPGTMYTEEMPNMARYGPGLIKICENYWVKLLTDEDFDENYEEFQEKLTDRNIDLIDQERAAYVQRNR